jgi:hypothetical protein
LICFTSHSRIHLLASLCSALKDFEQGGISNMPHLRFSGLIRRTAPFCRILRHTRVCGGSILPQILTGRTVDKQNILVNKTNSNYGRVWLFTGLRYAQEYFM